MKRLLEFYKNNVTEIISALLEDNLHPSVSGLDRSETDTKVESVAKTSIPNLYHKKAKKKRDEMGNREEQIYINAIASKYKYVDEVEEDEQEGEVDNATGIKYQTNSKRLRVN